MNFKASVTALLFLTILTVSLASLSASALAQPIDAKDDLVCTELPDSKELVRRLKDYEILREMDKVKDQRIANLEKELELTRRESELKDRVIAIKDMEIRVHQQAFDRMKEVSDRAMKLAEVSKPKSNWELYGILAVAVFVAGLLIGM